MSLKQQTPTPTPAMETENKFRVHKIVLTGGPCGGKTTGQSRLSTFFENLGWKVFRVPETATILLSGGVKFSDLNAERDLVFTKGFSVQGLQVSP